MGHDAERIIQALQDAEVAGADDFGHFVNNTKYLAPSSFDERAAMNTLLGLLPTIDDPRDLEAAVRHLGRAWARPVAFEPLRQVFLTRAEHDQALGWSMGNSLVTTAAAANLNELLEMASDRKFGTARQMIVNSLWRFKKDPRVKEILLGLTDDPDVSQHAMSALRRTIGNDEAIAFLRTVRDSTNNQTIRKQAQRAISKGESAMAKSAQTHSRHGLSTRSP